MRLVQLMLPAVAVVLTFTACGGLSEAEERYNDGVEAQEAGRLDEAVAFYTEAIELDPELAEAYLNRSLAYGDLGRSDEAVEDATKVIELEPSDVDVLAQAYVNRSYALGDRYEEALADDNAAIELEPNDDILAQAYGNRAIDLTGLGRFEDVEADFAKACELGLAEACGPASTACPTPVPGNPATIGEWTQCEFARCPDADLSDIAGGYGPLC